MPVRQETRPTPKEAKPIKKKARPASKAVKPIKKKARPSPKGLSQKTFESSMKKMHGQIKELYQKLDTLLSKFTLFEERLNNLEKKTPASSLF